MREGEYAAVMSTEAEGDRDTWKEANGEESASLGKGVSGNSVSRWSELRIVDVERGRAGGEPSEKRKGGDRDRVNAERSDAMLRCARF